MRLSELLKRRREEILSRFGERLRESPAPTDGISYSVLLDGLPSFLDELIEDLGEPEPPEKPAKAGLGVDTGVVHGEQRYKLGFDVVAVVREWAILRDIILELILAGPERVMPEEYRTLSRHMSAALIAAVQEHAEISDRERASYIGFMVHDVRNQLLSATAALSWLRSTPAQEAEAIRAIEASLGELRHVLERELTRARLAAMRSGTDISRYRVRIADLVALVVGETRALAAVRNVRVTTHGDPELAVNGDLRLLRSALVNVVGNAVKFTGEGTEVVIRAHGAGDVVELRVSDRCGGLRDESRERLFAEPTRSDPDRSGFGLGLAITRQAVEAHGGTITVENTPGAGCTFVLRIPRA